MKKFVLFTLFALVIANTLSQATALAGVIIIDGTDSNDHGSFNGVVNVGGWEYMQRVLENLGASRLAANPLGPKTVYNIGANTGTQSGNAIQSAFNRSSLASSGWSLTNVTGATNIGALLSNLNANVHGILAFTTAGNSGGDLDALELAQMNANAVNIDNYLLAGGAMHAMAQSGVVGANGYLTTLVPGLIVSDVGAGGLSSTPVLTAAGVAAFPGLTNSDIAGAEPWHNYFSGDLGALTVLGTAPQGLFTRSLILGGSTGSITTPGTVPEPSTFLVFGLGALGLFVRNRRNQRAAV